MKSFLFKIFTFTIIFTIIGLFIISPNTASAKKRRAKKLTKEEITQLNETIDNLTKKIYSAGLFSPQDNNKLIDSKMKIDNAFQSNPTSLDFPTLYYKLAFIYKQRDYKDEAIECYTAILENFADSPYTLKASNKLKKMGVKIQSPEEASLK